jgi:23S rRNA (adenine2030-N6)-methyltransferase
MNYRHHFHAGNFADVFKHTLLVGLLRAMQRKEKGFLFLDTHAGRGGYDLEATVPGRTPEWPGGIGRLWEARDLPAGLADYVELVRTFNDRKGGAAAGPRFYPGSPWLARLVARPQDRLALVELREDDAEALAADLGKSGRVSVRQMNGYTALKALLPPPERRALVLIDPPYEQKQESAEIVDGLAAALRRLPGGTYGIWYPLTERTRDGAGPEAVRALALPPTWFVELAVAGGDSPLRMKGCGMLVVNPPWQFESTIAPVLRALVSRLGIDASAGERTGWLVTEAGGPG